MLQRQSTEHTDDTNVLASGFETIEVSDDVLQHYHHLQKIGHGAQGTMLKALDDTDHPVAIKVFDFGTVREWKDVELFEREIDVLKNLNIDGVPRYIETIKTDKVIYLVEEYIDAQSIEKQMKNGRNFTVDECTTILERTAKILTMLGAHTPPIIHRDIKPANLLVDNALNVWLVDFGVVMNTQQTFSMTFAGTAGYVAPEQLYGKANPASDIFSLGATMLHLVSHVSPSDMDLKGITPDFDKYIPKSVPLWLSDTIRQMMSVNPDERPQDGQKLLELIQENKHKSQQNAPSIQTLQNTETKTKSSENIKKYTDYYQLKNSNTLSKLSEAIKIDKNLHSLHGYNENTSEQSVQSCKVLIQDNKKNGTLRLLTTYLIITLPTIIFAILVYFGIIDGNFSPYCRSCHHSLAGPFTFLFIVICLIINIIYFKTKFTHNYKQLKSTNFVPDINQSNPGLRVCVNGAIKGKAEAQYHLANRYDLGIDLKQDKYLAIEWYKLAAEQGHKEAQHRLVELYNELADHIS